jgi:hypothetical protein
MWGGGEEGSTEAAQVQKKSTNGEQDLPGAALWAACLVSSVPRGIPLMILGRGGEKDGGSTGGKLFHSVSSLSITPCLLTARPF